MSKVNPLSNVGVFSSLKYAKTSMRDSEVACRRWNVNNASHVGEAYGNIEYLRNLPNMLRLGCYLVTENHNRKKLDPTNHYKFATGEDAALDGTMGDYMWGWGTKWYYSFWQEGDYFYEAASLKPIAGRENYVIPVGSISALGVSVIDRDEQKLVSVVSQDPRYRGGDNDASLDGTALSYLGMAGTKQTAAKFGEMARKKGLGWEGYWYAHAAVVGILFRIIFGNRNVQATFNANKDSNGLYQGGLGAGVTSGWPGGFGSRPFLQTSVGVELADACGVSNVEVTGTDGSVKKYGIPVFFGLKNFFGYLGRWERGELISKIASGGGEVFILPKMHDTYDMSSLNGLVKVGEIPPCKVASTYEYIEQLCNQNLAHFPVVSGGKASASAFYCDALYNDNAVSGLRVPSRGGVASNGSSAGLEYLHAHHGVSTSYVYFGSPLCESAENWDTTPVMYP